MQKRVEKLAWLRGAEEFEASGQTLHKFARRRGLSLSTLQAWGNRRSRQARVAAESLVRMLPVQVSSTQALAKANLEVVRARELEVHFLPTWSPLQGMRLGTTAVQPRPPGAGPLLSPAGIAPYDAF
ncbi:IS66 family insertion sequence element accessory protein TnpA [Corallococcus interemptor]|uniref:IS66 family insertion sequence element accessory protein TnpA n=1 Tax=Corallococcus interemptor TaxID=2316720 RepID=UPI003CFCBD00